MSDRGVILKIATTGDLRDMAFDEAALKKGIVIGRHPDCGVTISGSDLVSSHHAELSLVGDTVHLKDLNSTNGAFLDGDAVDASGIVVKSGQVVSLGKKGPKISVMLVGFGDMGATMAEGSGPAGNMTKMIDKAAGKKLRRAEKEALKAVAKELDKKSSRSRAVMLVGLLVVILGAAGFFYWKNLEDKKAIEEEDKKLKQNLAETNKRQSDAERRQDETQKKVDATASRISETDRRLEEMRRTLSDLTDAQRKELTSLKSTFEASRQEDATKIEEIIRNSKSQTEIFQGFIKDYSDSVFLIYAEIPLTNKAGLTVEVVGGFGTGWIADDGLIVTNKHVIFPHRFNQELQQLKLTARRLLNDESIEWNEPQALIAAWAHGATFRLNKETLDFKEAWVRESKSPDPKRPRMLRVSYLPPEDNIFVGPDLIQVHNTDSANDLAILHLKGISERRILPMLPAAEVQNVPTFSSVLALGFPRGASAIQGTHVLASPVSGAIRKNEWQEGVISTSVPVIPGNSGGPLIDEKGRVIGVTSRGFETTQNDAITIDHVHAALTEGRKLMRSW